MAVEIKQLTKNIEVKTPLTQKQKEGLLKQISDAHQIIEDETEELKIHRENVKDTCDTQDEIISRCLSTYRKGYESKMVECVAKYEKGEATFTDVHTGEIVESRLITEEEQLLLSGKIIDAEQIIRQASKEEE